MSQIVDFLEGKGTDNKGRYLSDIWVLPILLLEGTHNFIQWIFPLNQPSHSNRFAPILTEQDCIAIRNSEVAQANLLKSLHCMCQFWGIEIKGNQFVAQEGLDRMKINHFWLRRSNHNQLRMTRVIKSLAMLGQPELAKGFQQGILTIAKDYNINEETLKMWETAL